MRNPLPKGYTDTRENVGNPINAEKLAEFTQKASSMGIRTMNFQYYQGDPNVLNNILDHLNTTTNIPGTKQKDFILNYDNVLGYTTNKNGKDIVNPSVIDVDAFAETKGKVITLNKFMFDDSQYLKTEYESSVEKGIFAPGTTYLNIVDHEKGHITDANNPALYNRVIEVIESRAYNEGTETQEYIQKNISRYASGKLGETRYSELIAELNAMRNGNEQNLQMKF